MTEASLEDLASAAADGDQAALAELLRRVQHPIYGLALRFLGTPADAEDATQEIMIRLMTRLATFEGRSKFMTWVYAVAVRMLIRTRQRVVETSVQGSEQFGRIIDAGLGARDYTADEAEYRLLCDEVRVSCSYGMLLCLSRSLRAAYLLGDVLGIAGAEGAAALDISESAFRQRVSRARRILRQVIDGRCGLIDQANTCSCGRQIEASIEGGIISVGDLPLATHPRTAPPDAIEKIAVEIDAVVAIGSLYRADQFEAPGRIWDRIQTEFPSLVGG
ncbi:MAG TPA: RNA polymerase sigma factor [Actinobacteria bacterium]|nr:RNA polymerase sigma factor [Actinomycetota bacterium]